MPQKTIIQFLNQFIETNRPSERADWTELDLLTIKSENDQYYYVIKMNLFNPTFLKRSVKQIN